MATHRTTMSSRSREPPVAEIQVGDFIRKNEIGKGSFATVYLASHKKRKSYAAIKTVTMQKLTGKLRENLNSEISILRSLQHPHIVALFACVDTPQYIHLVMEYCQMSDLAAFMKGRARIAELPETRDIFRKYPNRNGGGLNEVLARHFLKQIASALQYLRSRNFIHRDIKPQNLLLNPPPTFMQRQRPEDVPLAASENSLIPAVGVASLPMLKLADFGFARHLSNTSLAETLCGSPLYMAPEILAYQKYDAKADLWSVGTVAFEMVAGKPPFKASNHVELLRRIDQAQDQLQFPAGVEISRGFKDTIKSLLKRQPTQRVSFERFFSSSTITGEIPGLVEEDILRTDDTSESDAAMLELSIRMHKQSINNPAQEIDQAEISRAVQDSHPVALKKASPPSPSPAIDSPRRPSTGILRTKTAIGTTMPHADNKRHSLAADPKRPTMMPTATAPSGAELKGLPPSNQRKATNPRYISSPSTSAPQQSHMFERPSRESRERNAAYDLTFEKDYVLVEKQAVEVNAFADELAVRNQHTGNQAGAMVRRATTQGMPSTSIPSSQSNALQMVPGRRADTLHGRQPSFERRYAPTAANYLSRALNAANVRIWGALGSSPNQAQGVSPPQGYGAFTQPSAPALPLVISDGRTSPGILDEDMRMINLAEDGATRSDVVYSFAEVKYQQLLPATPSSDEKMLIRRIGASDEPMRADEETEDQELTQIAIVAVAEEAFVLYVKALAILVKTINLVRYWWDRQRTADTPPGSLPTRLGETRPGTAEMGKKMNNVVQWVRNRFNECLEKSEVVGRRLMEAQKQLPPSHPGHPSNHVQLLSSGSGNTFGVAVDQIQLTSGVTAEKLMFDRAVEMSRAAAINELTGTDFSGCELSYVTSVMLLEAVLENDDDPLLSRPSANRTKASINGMESEDRDAIIRLAESTRGRLDGLRRKLRQQAAAKQMPPTGPKAVVKTSSSPVTALGTPPQ